MLRLDRDPRTVAKTSCTIVATTHQPQSAELILLQERVHFRDKISKQRLLSLTHVLRDPIKHNRSEYQARRTRRCGGCEPSTRIETTIVARATGAILDHEGTGIALNAHVDCACLSREQLEVEVGGSHTIFLHCIDAFQAK